MQVTTIGLDMAKHWFQVHGVDADGRVVVRRKLRRSEMIAFFSVAAAERDWHGSLCNGAPLGARADGARAMTVKLMPRAYVKAYVKRNKNDAADAEAIYEAVGASVDALRAGEGYGSAVGVAAASGAQPVRAATDHAGQCIAYPHGGVRHHRAAGSRDVLSC